MERWFIGLSEFKLNFCITFVRGYPLFHLYYIFFFYFLSFELDNLDEDIFRIIYIRSPFILVAAELKMDVLREREKSESSERQLANEQKRRSKLFFILTCLKYYFFNINHAAIFVKKDINPKRKFDESYNKQKINNTHPMNYLWLFEWWILVH